MVRASGINQQASNEDIRRLFGYCGKIRDMQIGEEPRNDPIRTKRAFVAFETTIAAKAALRLDGTHHGPALCNNTLAGKSESAYGIKPPVSVQTSWLANDICLTPTNSKYHTISNTAILDLISTRNQGAKTCVNRPVPDVVGTIPAHRNDLISDAFYKWHAGRKKGHIAKSAVRAGTALALSTLLVPAVAAIDVIELGQISSGGLATIGSVASLMYPSGNDSPSLTMRAVTHGLTFLGLISFCAILICKRRSGRRAWYVLCSLLPAAAFAALQPVKELQANLEWLLTFGFFMMWIVFDYAEAVLACLCGVLDTLRPQEAAVAAAPLVAVAVA
jgi:hypothetical protein